MCPDFDAFFVETDVTGLKNCADLLTQVVERTVRHPEYQSLPVCSAIHLCSSKPLSVSYMAALLTPALRSFLVPPHRDVLQSSVPALPRRCL